MLNQMKIIVILKIIIWIAALAPLIFLVWNLSQDMGANPVETILRTTGDWAIRLLLLSLFITPLRWVLQSSILIKFRRLLGLFAFFHSSLHLLIWFSLENSLDWSLIWADILDRSFITMGMATFLMLLPLAVTSTQGWIKRLRKKWTILHKLVYPASIAGMVHFLWIQKADLLEPLIYSSILALALCARLMRFVFQRSRARAFLEKQERNPLPRLPKIPQPL